GRLLLWGVAGGEVVRDPHAKAHGANGRPVGDEEWIAVAPPLGGLLRHQLDVQHTTNTVPIHRAILVDDVNPVATSQPAPITSATAGRRTALVRTREDVKRRGVRHRCGRVTAPGGPAPNVMGGQSAIVVWQTYIQDTADAWLTFTRHGRGENSAHVRDSGVPS